MRTNRSITITLPQDMAELVDRKVSSGEFANESEVVTEGLRHLADHDDEIEQWLKAEVVPTLSAHDPAQAIPLDEVRRRINAHMDARDKEARLRK